MTRGVSDYSGGASDVPVVPVLDALPVLDSLYCVGHSMPRADAVSKVQGRARYTSDLVLPGMCYAAVVRSSVAHARIVSIDIGAALRSHGVLDVLRGDDLRSLPEPYYGHALRDHPVLALGKVRYVGEPVAAVVGVDELSAQEAARLVTVEYAQLDYVTDAESATRDEAPLIHESRSELGPFGGIEAIADDRLRGLRNLCHAKVLEWGDVDAAMKSARYVVAERYSFPMGYAYAMEPYVAVADYRDGALRVYSSTQHPFMVRQDLASVFGLPLSAVEVIVDYVGGGYGSKSYTKIEPLVAACAQRVARPVKLSLTVEEAILTTRVASAVMYVRTGADASGRLLARDATLYFNGGGYAENGPRGTELSPRHMVAPYAFPNVRIRSLLVYTNTAPSSSYRGFSSSQVTFAGESQLDELASLCGADPIELRLANLVKKGETAIPGLRALDGDVPADVELARSVLFGAEAQRAVTSPRRTRGRGLAVMALGAGAQPTSTARVTVHDDNSVTVASGTTEMGQGSETVLAQIAAEELGVDFYRVRVERAATAWAPFDRSTGASRSTTIQGRALIEACKAVRKELRSMALAVECLDSSHIVEARGGLTCGGEFFEWGRIIRGYFGIAGCEAVGTGHVRQAGDLAVSPMFWEMSVAGVEVEVDRDTGIVQLARLVTVADVGRAINPALVESQDLGAAVQGLGTALFEELRYSGQTLENGSMLHYRVPRFTDVAGCVESMVAERQDGVGPYGAKGGGEGAIGAVPPAIAGAVENAVGVRIRTLPLTPERVWRALNGLADWRSCVSVGGQSG